MLIRRLGIWGCLAASVAFAQDDQQGPSTGIPPGIVWHGVLQDGLAEAKESGKPILLVSAAPQCAGVSGMW